MKFHHCWVDQQEHEHNTLHTSIWATCFHGCEHSTKTRTHVVYCILFSGQAEPHFYSPQQQDVTKTPPDRAAENLVNCPAGPNVQQIQTFRNQLSDTNRSHMTASAKPFVRTKAPNDECLMHKFAGLKPRPCPGNHNRQHSQSNQHYGILSMLLQAIILIFTIT